VAGIGATIASEDGAQINQLMTDAIQVANEVELEDDLVGAFTEATESASDKIETVATAIANNLKDCAIAIGRLNDTAAAEELGLGRRLNVHNTLWDRQMNTEIIQALIDQGNRFYLASPVNAASCLNANNAMNKEGELSVFGEELVQLFRAGCEKSGDFLLPPGGE
jgi:hypothetical protein